MGKQITGGPKRKNRPGQGRPTMTGQRMKEHRITLPPEVAEYIRSLSGGNLSAGIRKLATEHRQSQDGS